MGLPLLVRSCRLFRCSPLSRRSDGSPPLFFGLCCASYSVACCVLCGSINYNLFPLQSLCVDARLKMHIFGASSFAATIQSLPGGVFSRRQHLTALPGLHLNNLSAKSPRKTLQFQLHQILRLRHTTKSPPSRLQIIIWHLIIP